MRADGYPETSGALTAEEASPYRPVATTAVFASQEAAESALNSALEQFQVAGRVCFSVPDRGWYGVQLYAHPDEDISALQEHLNYHVGALSDRKKRPLVRLALGMP